MDLNTALNALRGRSIRPRSVYREMVKADHDGLPVGILQKGLSIPSSTLSHR